MNRIAAVDVGSNALKMMVADVTRQGNVKVVATKRESVRLGKDVFAKGQLTPETQRLAVNAFKNFRSFCTKSGVIAIKAVATSALREARNGQLLVEDVLTQTGIKLEIISGLEEARLIQLAVSKKVNFKKKLAVVIDLGGGSTEVSLVYDGNIVFSESHKIGAVRLLHLLEVQKYPFKVFARLVSDYVKGLRSQLKREIGNRHVDFCVVTGGNFESIGELNSQLLGKDQHRVSQKDLKFIIGKINSLSYNDRIKILGLKPDRADVIGPAAAVLDEVMKQAGVSEVRIPFVGLKDGIIADLLPQIKGNREQVRRNQLVACAEELCLKYQADIKHSKLVAARAVELFDKTHSLHGRGKSERILLELAALMHDIGHFVGTVGHHKHSLYLIKAASFIGLDQRSQKIVACVARYHRKSIPKVEHECYRDFEPEDQILINHLSAILRIADGMIRGHGKVGSFIARKSGNKYLITLKGRGNLLLEKWAISKKSDLFEKCFNLKVEVRA